MAVNWDTNVSTAMVKTMWDYLSAMADDLKGQALGALDAAGNKAGALDVGVDGGDVNSRLGALSQLKMPTHGATAGLPVGSPAPAGFNLPVAPRAPIVRVPTMGTYAPLDEFGPAPSLDGFGRLDMDSLRNLYDSDRMEMLAALKQSFTEFMGQYFPEGQYFNKARTWLERALEAQGTGIPIQIEAQIWERDRARIGAESKRATADATKAWAARGYMLPPGALVGQVAAIRRGQLDQLSQQSRDIAIKVTDVHIENARFAVEQSLKLRNDAIDAAVNYIKALMVSPEVTGQWIGNLIDGQAKMAQAEADIYRTKAGVATDVFKTEAGVQLDQFKTGADVAIESGRLQSTTELGVYTATNDAERQKFLAQLEAWRTSEANRLETYKITEDKMIRYYEADIRARSAEAEMITRAGELSLRLAEATAQNTLAQAKMLVDTTMEQAKTLATTLAATVNNMNLSASTSNNTSVQQRVE